MKWTHNPITWGAGLLAVFTTVGLVAGYLYVSPPGRQTISFYTDDVASVRPGDEVRIAGINVGRVKDMSLEQNLVRVNTQIDKSAFVGDKSQIQVRMLTVVGGYYVNLVSSGTKPLGSEVIPQERVVMPYSLITTLTDATKITDNVNPKPIRQSVDEIQAGLTGDNLEALRAVIDAGNSIMSTVDKQRGQVTKILNVSDEYIETLAGYREELKSLLRKVALLQQALSVYSVGWADGLVGISKVMEGIGKPLGPFYQNHREEIIEKIRNWQQSSREWMQRYGAVAGVLKRTQTHIMKLLAIQNEPAEFLATDLCFPVPGKAC